ncbi:hypothetical protein [Mesorhizobium amorphae]|uniref:hypothetical protein n=1 Tax=Mesorhizobium amorphae TaxID=71433 RepID=UPI0011827322|nr:hypothetical protein [Mesorhizobium amorphae]
MLFALLGRLCGLGLLGRRLFTTLGRLFGRFGSRLFGWLVRRFCCRLSRFFVGFRLCRLFRGLGCGLFLDWLVFGRLLLRLRRFLLGFGVRRLFDRPRLLGRGFALFLPGLLAWLLRLCGWGFLLRGSGFSGHGLFCGRRLSLFLALLALLAWLLRFGGRRFLLDGGSFRWCRLLCRCRLGLFLALLAFLARLFRLGRWFCRRFLLCLYRCRFRSRRGFGRRDGFRCGNRLWLRSRSLFDNRCGFGGRNGFRLRLRHSLFYRWLAAFGRAVTFGLREDQWRWHACCRVVLDWQGSKWRRSHQQAESGSGQNPLLAFHIESPVQGRCRGP